MKVPRSARFTSWMGAVCLMLTLLFLAGCQTSPTRTPRPEPPQADIESSAEQAFGAAEVLRREQRNAEALQAFADFIEQFSDSPLGDDARLAAGQLATALGRPDDAAAALTDLIGKLPGLRASVKGVSQSGALAVRSTGLHRQLGGPAERP